MASLTSMTVHQVSERVDLVRLDASRNLDAVQQAKHGQFFTALPIARLMAGMFGATRETIRILDAGAGVGSLFAACVVELCHRPTPPRRIEVVAYEIDPVLCQYLHETIRACAKECDEAGIEFAGEVREADFLECAADQLTGILFKTGPREEFDWVILNPPYYKIRASSPSRRLLERIGMPTSNIYTGFLAAAVQLLAPGGELVAITPRSFCNGPYFRDFRHFFLSKMSLQDLHLFESRQHAFRDQAVLQENVIFHARHGKPTKTIEITLSHGPDDEAPLRQQVPYAQVVMPEDPEAFIRILPDELDQQIADQVGRFGCTLNDLSLNVSTGRVVDFRATEFLRAKPTRTTVPLIYPRNLDAGYVAWPKEGGKKPHAIEQSSGSDDLLVPNDFYVLTKRFSAKEERRRVVAAVYDPTRFHCKRVGFENHLNYFHCNGRGLSEDVARGLAAYLNSTLLDRYFRQFSGHTQVNSSDLRNMKYPTRAQLESLGRRIGATFPNQNELDALVNQELLDNHKAGGVNPVRTMKRIDEAIDILKSLGLPGAQSQERSALTLLALLDLKPDMSWAEATNPLRGITPMMDFFAEHYGKKYAPNSRETVRRQTVHQFLDAGLILQNPDDQTRPTNSGKNVYQMESSALELLRTYGTSEWIKNLKTYLASTDTLQARYKQERQMARIPLNLGKGTSITLSPGGQNVLVKHIIDEFAPRFTPGGDPIYVGDTDDKFAHFDEKALRKLGVKIEAHGKMPDVVIYFAKKKWLVLIEAVTSHGPVNPKRHAELKRLFKDSTAGLVFVTAFLDRKAMVQYLGDISWETEVWVADSPTHLIHFNGERFLGPY
jgi:adenine-specific DNA-methyltransferase